MKNIRKIGKKTLVIMTILSMVGIATAGILLFYANIDTTVNVSPLIEMDGNPIENTLMTNEITGYGGDVNVTMHTLLAHRNANISFEILSPEIETEIRYYDSNYLLGGIIDGDLYLPAETPILVNFVYKIPYNLTSGTYNSNITIKAP